MQSDIITLPSSLPLVGDLMINQWVLLIILIAAFVGLIILFAIPTAFLTYVLDRSVTNVKEDDDFKANVATLQKKEKERVKTYLKESPPDPIPSHERPGWSVISTSMLIGLFMAFFGAAFSNEFLGGANALSISLGCAAVGILSGVALLRPSLINDIDSSEGSPISGGTLWVIVTGLLVVMLGLGVMMWVRSAVA